MGKQMSYIEKNSGRQNSTYLTPLKDQNIQPALYKLPKNHWVFALVKILGSVRKKNTFDSLVGSPCMIVITVSTRQQFCLYCHIILFVLNIVR